MPDVWSAVAALDAPAQQRLAEVLETRGADPQQQEMRRRFLSDLPFPSAARVLEVGCGTGVLTRVLAGWPGVREVIGIDPAPLLLAKARQLAAASANISFQEGDARSLAFADAAFDVVVFDSTLCHVPDAPAAVAEAFRVLRPKGWLAAFDGDYATTTVTLGRNDPLQACASATMDSSVNDLWLARRLPTLARAAGFQVVQSRSHGFVDTEGGYVLTIIDRGADILHAAGQIGEATAASLKAEARRRIEAGTFFGHIAYASIIARKLS